MKALITDIKRNSLDDGPGVRSVTFFKGCPLRCVWCQNPETQSVYQEIHFDYEVCVQCHECKNICPVEAIEFSNFYPINKKICNYCGKCVRSCEMEALKFVGKTYNLQELLDLILLDKIFYQNSGGGITLSGGEPTMQVRFLHELLKKVKENSIHVCLETCGFFKTKEFFEKILPFVDVIYFDLKIFDEMEHKKYCGVSNKLILQNFERLLAEESITVLPRIPLIPSITTNKENLLNWVNYLEKFNIKKIGLLPYNPLWLSKMKHLGHDFVYYHKKWLSDKEKNLIKNIFSQFEFRNF
ncbi:MAG: glycyl-radical enzyme activating protein [Candidatus Lokiarchaeota archaeon]|nr:glycyl-radical enzyme activating protein [Candidatus Lokiarchaeota archaeon]